MPGASASLVASFCEDPKELVPSCSRELGLLIPSSPEPENSTDAEDVAAGGNKGLVYGREDG